MRIIVQILIINLNNQLSIYYLADPDLPFNTCWANELNEIPLSRSLQWAWCWAFSVEGPEGKLQEKGLSCCFRLLGSGSAGAWKDIWVQGCSHRPRTQPQLCLSWDGSRLSPFHRSLNMIPHTQGLLPTLAPLSLFAWKLRRVCLPSSLCHGPLDRDTVLQAPALPGRLFALHVYVPSLLAPSPLHVCMLAVVGGSPHRHCAPSSAASEPLSPLRATCLTAHLCPAGASPWPSSTPEGCFLLTHELPANSGLG